VMQDMKPPDRSLSANRSMYPGEASQPASQPPTFWTNRSIPDGGSRIHVNQAISRSDLAEGQFESVREWEKHMGMFLNGQKFKCFRHEARKLEEGRSVTREDYKIQETRITRTVGKCYATINNLGRYTQMYSFHHLPTSSHRKTSPHHLQPHQLSPHHHHHSQANSP
jgi:hypothetical protein